LPSPNSHNQVLNYGGYVALALAIAVRLIIYLMNRSLFIDEAFLAFNLIERDWLGLLSILDYEQAAPIGFLLVTEFVTMLAGHSEYALRLFPTVLSVLSCVILFKLMSEIAPPATAIILLWFTSADLVLRYATEFKQYAGDVFFALLLIYVVLRALKSTEHPQRDWAIWAGVASVAVWFSHPSVFVIAGIGFSVMLSAVFQHDWVLLRRVIIACGMAAISFGIVFFGFYQATATGTALSDHMTSFWSNNFFVWTPLALVRFILIIFQNMIGFDKPFMVGLIIFGFGFVIGLRRLPLRTTGLFLLPILVTMVASSLELYPLAERFLLFALTGVMVIVSVGLTDFYSTLQQANRWVAYTVAIGVIVYLFWGVTVDYRTYQARAVYAEIEATQANEADVIYAALRANYMARYYEVDVETFTETDVNILGSAQSEGLVWVVYSGRDFAFHASYEPIAQAADQAYMKGETSYFCFDGTVRRCPLD